MKRDREHSHAGSHRRVGTDVARRSTRRKMLVLLGGSALAPLAALAQNSIRSVADRAARHQVDIELIASRDLPDLLGGDARAFRPELVAHTPGQETSRANSESPRT